MYIGLDYHRHFIQLCVLDRAGTVLCNRRCDNLRCDLLEVAGGFGTRIRAVIEAEIEVGCGAVDLADALTTAGWSVSLAHAGYVSRIRQSPDKTDFSDA